MSRIRTIKPEFWRHEDLSALPEPTHMLAAALLNYADDDGYFNANPKLVQAECSPLREPSVSIHGSLISLSEIGYIRLGTGIDGRRIGQIVSFSQHQVINRKTDSKIKESQIKWDDSLITHGALTEPSLPEGKGKEGNGKEIDGAKAPYRFSGKIIRLNEEDFERWKQSFSRVELVGYLEARDVFLSELPIDDQRRKKWMTSTASDLRNKNAAAKARAPVSVAQAAEGWRQEAEKQIAARDQPLSSEEKARRIEKAEKVMHSLRGVN